jgi:hypothetical protein
MNLFKFLVIAATTFLIVSCDNSQNSSQEKKIEKLKVETYIDTARNKFAGFETNGAIKDELNNFLKTDFKKAIDKGVLADLPFKLDKVEKCGSQYILDLEHSLTSKFYDRGILSILEVDLYALTDEKTAKSLQEGQFYLADVEFKEYITFQNNEKYCALVLMSPFMGYFDNEIQFGAIGVRLKKIEKFVK